MVNGLADVGSAGGPSKMVAAGVSKSGHIEDSEGVCGCTLDEIKGPYVDFLRIEKNFWDYGL